MHARLFSSQHPRSSSHLQSWDSYREMELTANKQLAVTDAGDLLEYETLVSRLLPPNVKIDNEMYEDKTVLIVDSANRPGTLVEVVQCLTELGLSVKQARISSDGGWFVDEFHVSETPSGRVTDPKKINAIKSVLSLPEHTGEPAEAHTVFQIAGPETPGLLAEITELLSHNGLEIRTAAAWTFHNRAAIVIGVTERNAPVADRVKLHRLRQLIVKLVERQGDAAVSVEQVEGPVHHERRLHQLLLADEVHAWKQLSRLQRQHSLPFPAPICTATSGAAAAAADADADIDQAGLPHTPKTPRQQWQRRMLPPQWTVDQLGKPIHRDTSTDVTIQQHMQQQQQEAPQAAAAAAVEALSFAAPSNAASLDGPDGLAAAALPVVSEGAPLPAGSNVSRDGGMAARDAAAAAAAAAQQASVDKLIALLQPQPLAHMASFSAVRQQQQQQQAAAGKDAEAGGGTDQGATASNSNSSSTDGHRATAEQQQKQQKAAGIFRSVPEPQSDLLAAVSAASAASTDGSAAGSAANAAGGAASHGHATQPGLPPRPPSALSSHLPLPPAQQHSQHFQQQQQQPGYSSASAPSSPAAPKPSRVAGAAGAGLAPIAVGSVSATSGHAAVPFSPGRLASAAAAAGQLSPRGVLGLSGAASAPLGSLPAAAAAAAGSGGVFGIQQQQQQQGGGDLGTPEVQIQHSSLFNYWLVTIRCRDRNKLFFDTVCTLCDMRYDIFHATIDGEPSGWAYQLFYIRPRFGECVWDERRASVLQAMLVGAVQRRFPPGLRVHVFSGSNVVLQDLVRAMKRHRLTITRCKVRAYESASHTFSLLNQDGSLPSRQYVQMACQSAGGELVEAPLDLSNPCVATVLRSLDARGRFAFSFVNLRAYKLRGTAPAPAGAAAAGNVPHARYPAGEDGMGLAGGFGAAGGGDGVSSGHHMFREPGGFGGDGRTRQGALTMVRPAVGRSAGVGSGGGSDGGASYNSDHHPSF